MQANQTQPLILTLSLDEKNQAFFDAQRKKYFPSERNYLKAHLTLFHKLPDEVETFDYFANISHSSFSIAVIKLISLGGGVAYRMESLALTELHKNIAGKFSEQLIPQDRQPFKPHITIQNKVLPADAKALLNELTEIFEPFQVTATGLDVWRYLNGPWEHLKHYSFDQ